MSGESNIVPSIESSPRIKHHHFRRTRTGCERCRAQHRKCDEGKPRCKRCINAGSVCKYATHVSFKLKNSLTLFEDVPQTSGSSRPLTYHSIEFLLEDGLGRTSFNSQPTDQTDNAISEHEGSSLHEAQRSSAQLSNQSWSTMDRSSLSVTEVELLRFYNHSVAPWLDVYDQRHTFRYCVTRLAMTTPCLLEGLLQVSALCANRPIETVTRRRAGISHFHSMMNPPGEQSPSSALQTTGCFVLARTLLFVDTVPDTWEPSFHGSGAFGYFRKFQFLDATERDMWFALLTLILRFEVAYCLMNCAAPTLMPELILHILDQLAFYETSADRSQQVLYSCLRCLKLLVDSMNFAFHVTEGGDDPGSHQFAGPASSDGARLTQWTELTAQLCAWYNSRPQELTPLFETEEFQDTFPVLIFSNGAGVSSNALYHAAMLLLFSSKPQSLSDHEAQMVTDIDATQTMLMWHARCTCGIAVNSEPERTGCWDPILIAAFVLAARHITQSSERWDIIKCLTRVKTAGWRVDSLIENLRDEWGIDGRRG